MFSTRLFNSLAGNTPLHIAAGRKMKDIVALLMAYGANPSITNSEGDIPHDLPPAALVSDDFAPNSEGMTLYGHSQMYLCNELM